MLLQPNFKLKLFSNNLKIEAATYNKYNEK